jgi:hypothetical protein
MASIELPYVGFEVRTEEQAKEFLDSVLLPAADLIAGGSFIKSGIDRVARLQELSTGSSSGSWTDIGFEATRLRPDDDPTEVLYNIWAYNAADTSQFPFSKKAKHAAAILTNKGVFGRNIIEQVLGQEVPEEELETDYKDEVVEQHDFYIDSHSLVPIRDVDFAYVRDGIVVWRDSAESLTVGEITGPMDNGERGMDKYGGLLTADKEFVSAFDELDLELIGGILQRLGLLIPK